MRPARTVHGFTLIELLVVIAILGILMALSFGSYMRWRQSTQVATSADLVALSINKTRQGAKRSNGTWEFKVVDADTFSYGQEGATASNGKLEAGTEFDTGSLGENVKFVAPWGARDGYGGSSSVIPQFTIRSKANTSITRTVSVPTLLGSVVVK